MREDAATDNQFRIDPDHVYAGGVSAGAICAAHAAVMDAGDDINEVIQGFIDDNGGFAGNTSDNYEYSSSIQGYINLSGGLSTATWMDADDPPFVSIHDDGDGVVPYDADFATYFGIPLAPLEGSLVLQMRADELGIPNRLRTIEGSIGHVSYLLTPEGFNESVAFTSEFIHDLLCGFVVATEEVPEALRGATLYPNPTTDVLQVKAAATLRWQLGIYDWSGRLVREATPGVALSVQGIPAATYHVRIFDLDTQTAIWQKVLVQ
ncbi:MAG: T9SS type A sorting domain-containing protein, partial [Bacteroidota bacterium]